MHTAGRILTSRWGICSCRWNIGFLDAVCLMGVQADSEEGQQACDDLGIEVIPTVQFWRGEKFLWEHRGYLQLDQDLGDGMIKVSILICLICRLGIPLQV